MPEFKIDLTGKRFGRLTVLKYAGKLNGRTGWICECDCGKQKAVEGHNLVSERTSSCGCYNAECSHAANNKHGKSNSKLFWVWNAMLRRCNDKKSKNYREYGQRGISVCLEWSEFVNFMEWATTSGYKEGLTLERIDNNSGYFPGNCRWATRLDQANNQRKNHYLAFDGEKHTVTEWARLLDFPAYKIRHYISLGWPDDKIVPYILNGSLGFGLVTECYKLKPGWKQILSRMPINKPVLARDVGAYGPELKQMSKFGIVKMVGMSGEHNRCVLWMKEISMDSA